MIRNSRLLRWFGIRQVELCCKRWSARTKEALLNEKVSEQKAGIEENYYNHI
ncbi:hypothetical protein [Alteribacter keqinensis]|uniref:hypothetical protein n=1 Tax=Alteribacter keqinensis TaxID=2483800 RepID=UPI001605E33C|nr:hypothetical protein [Alteribacter keqinensis]